MNYQEIQDSIRKLFASDEVDQHTALEAYQKLHHALREDQESQQILNISLSKIWMRRMVYQGKLLDETEGLRLSCDAKDKEVEKYRQVSENIWRETQERLEEKEELERTLEATRKNLREANKRADLYLTELLQLRLRNKS